MDELTIVWQVLDWTKNNRLECDTHKNVRANRVKLCKRTMRKLKAMKNMFKVERCVSSPLTSNRKNEFGKNCWFLNEIISKKCCESCSQWSVHCKTWNKKSLKAGERATSPDDCWCVSVHSTVNNAKRVQPDRGHHCGSKRNNRYDSTGLLSDK
jgi:hypothetical protein